jgi:hypothetical protein
MLTYELPSDVLQHHILSLLPRYSLVTCSMVNSHMQKYCSRMLRARMLRAPATTNKKNKKKSDQERILKSMIKEGVSVHMIEWFQQYLRYPPFSKNSKLVTLAALGIFLFFLCLLHKRILTLVFTHQRDTCTSYSMQRVPVLAYALQPLGEAI